MSTKKFLLLTLKMHVEVTQVHLELTSKMKIVISRFYFTGILSLCPSADHPVGDDLERCKSLFFLATNDFNTKSISNIFQATLRSSDHLTGPPSWPWAAAWAEILAIILSFSSLIVTAARFES